MKKKTLVFLSFILFFSGLIFCQFEKFKISASRTKIPPVIDGIVDNEEWKNASQVSDFTQFVPNKGEPALVKTIVKTLYDENYIYFAFICYDPEPENIQLGTNRRDGLASWSGTDSASVELDTFNNDRSSYYFRTNPSGVQHDGRVTDNGQNFDQDWDGIWKSVGSIGKQGWSAEIAIPFTTIKYRPGKNQTWGVQFYRYYPRKLEMSFWTGPIENKDKITNFGSLNGLDLEMTQKKLDMIPYTISRSQEDERTHFNVGLDASYALSQSISGHLTLNPDFATVEADREQINLTRFELNLPEKRNFFLEGNDIFKQRIRLFYSRRIADIYGGLKIYGKAGRYEISTLSVQTKETEELGSASNFTALRLKKEVMGSSYIGFLAANRINYGKNQGAFGLDASHSFTDTFYISGQVAASYGEKESDFAFYLRPTYIVNTFRIHLSYTYLGEHFGDNVNAVGFIRDDNRHELNSAITKTFWLRKWGLDRILYSSSYNIYWGIDKVLRSWNVWQSLAIDLHNKLSLKIRHDQEYKLYEKEFRNFSSTVELGYNKREWESASVGFQIGKNFDSDFTLLSGMIKKNIARILSFEYSLSKLMLSPDPEKKSTWIHIILTNLYFTKDLFLKCFYQINSSIDKHNIQAVFVYRFQPPFGQIQLAYQKGTAKLGEAGTQGHTLFM